jgi:hypothetical protein
MRLQEWKDSSGKKVSTTSTAGSTSSGSFKKRLNKLINYYGQHHPAKVDFITVNLLTGDTLDFTENYDNGDKVEFNIYIGPATEAWRLKVYVNGKLTDDLAGQVWGELLKTLRAYITVPVVSTPEYVDLFTESLKEWVDKHGKKVSQPASVPAANTSSKTNKEKFTSLLYHMKKNKPSETDKVEVVRLDDGGFTYKEHRKNSTGYEYTLTILVGYSRFNSQWKYELYMDTNLIEEKSGSGFNELINNLYAYFNTPKPGTKEYQSLVEWVDSGGNKVTLSKNNSSGVPSTTSQDQKDRYKRLLAQVDADRISTYKVNELNDTTLDITVDTAKKKDLNIRIVYNSSTDSYDVAFSGVSSKNWDYEKDILELFVLGGVINNTDLCEAISSIAEDFKTYENLWD